VIPVKLSPTDITTPLESDAPVTRIPPTKFNG
jgi:hypothetical protein